MESAWELEEIQGENESATLPGDAQLSVLVYPLSGDGALPPVLPPVVEEVVKKYGLVLYPALVSQRHATSREEWQLQCQLWPTSFHPNSMARRSVADISEKERRAMIGHMEAAWEQAKVGEGNGEACCGCIIVDPATGTVIAAGYDQTGGWACGGRATCTPAATSLPPGPVEVGGAVDPGGGGDASGEGQSPSATRCQHNGGARWHPLRHAVMVAIEAAAERDCRLFPAARVRLRGGGAEGVGMGEGEGEEHRGKKAKMEEMEGDPVVELGVRPYLCTGFEAYVTHEPCTMCAMALVHQRIRKLVYSLPNPSSGALGSTARLHALKGLNHHYTVYKLWRKT